MIRAGVWKPRTRPGGFEGLGAPALKWMQELQKEYGKPFCCEVARPEHVELCARHGITNVWLGARTTANPFMVEELCETLRGSKMQVMVKNPMNPDVRLWLGAIERLLQCGITVTAAIHRGFSMYDNHGYRNEPLWEVPMELHRRLPDLPLLCDPSHIAGDDSLVATVAKAAMQLDFDGLMVEVHPHPETAWSDREQQLTPAALGQLLEALRRLPTTVSGEALPALMALRGHIDDLDHELLTLLARRMELSREIADIKREKGLTIYQSKRWEAVMQDRLQLAADLGLDEDFTKELFEKIHAESVRVQMES
jgi:chorismate mutase